MTQKTIHTTPRLRENLTMLRTQNFALTGLIFVLTACGGSIGGGKSALAPEKDSGVKSASGTAISECPGKSPGLIA